MNDSMAKDSMRNKILVNKFSSGVLEFGALIRHCGLVIGYCLVLASCLLVISSSAFAQESGSFTQEKPAFAYDQFAGEVVSYNVRSLAMKMADARIEFKGQVDVDGQKVYLITFEAKGSNFFDRERIYADPVDLYPVRVERDVDYLGSVEKMIEVYDQQKYEVVITKTTKAKPMPEKIVIQKQAKIDNLYCFIYRYRLTGDFQLGSSLRLNLPTQDVSVQIRKKVVLDAAGKKFDALYFETTPSQYKLWFDVSKKKIPLRVDKTSMFTGTSMTMTDYSFQEVLDDKTR
jgi:hypothetical protein